MQLVTAFKATPMDWLAAGGGNSQASREENIPEGVTRTGLMQLQLCIWENAQNQYYNEKSIFVIHILNH